MTRFSLAYVAAGILALAALGFYEWGRFDGRTDRAVHTKVVILDATAPDAGPWFGRCLEIYPDHPVCAVDDRGDIAGLFYPNVAGNAPASPAVPSTQPRSAAP